MMRKRSLEGKNLRNIDHGYHISTMCGEPEEVSKLALDQHCVGRRQCHCPSIPNSSDSQVFVRSLQQSHISSKQLT